MGKTVSSVGFPAQDFEVKGSWWFTGNSDVWHGSAVQQVWGLMMKVLRLLPLDTQASANEASDSYLRFYNSLDPQVKNELKPIFLL